MKAISLSLQVNYEVGCYLWSCATVCKNTEVPPGSTNQQICPLPSLFLPDLGRLGVPLLLVFPVKWDCHRLPRKHLRTLGKLYKCLQFFSQPLQTVDPETPAFSGPVPTWKSEGCYVIWDHPLPLLILFSLIWADHTSVSGLFSSIGIFRKFFWVTDSCFLNFLCVEGIKPETSYFTICWWWYPLVDITSSFLCIFILLLPFAERSVFCLFSLINEIQLNDYFFHRLCLWCCI